MIADSLKGIVAGSFATLVVSGVMLLERVLGLTPELGVIQLLLRALSIADDQRIVGWIAHIIAGSILGGCAFAWIEPRLEGDSALKRGVLFGLLLWLVFMLVIMPAAGAGLFGFEISDLAPLVLLVLHVVYGIVLGWTFGRLRGDDDSAFVRRCLGAQRSRGG